MTTESNTFFQQLRADLTNDSKYSTAQKVLLRQALRDLCLNALQQCYNKAYPPETRKQRLHFPLIIEGFVQSGIDNDGLLDAVINDATARFSQINSLTELFAEHLAVEYAGKATEYAEMETDVINPAEQKEFAERGKQEIGAAAVAIVSEFHDISSTELKQKIGERGARKVIETKENILNRKARKGGSREWN